MHILLPPLADNFCSQNSTKREVCLCALLIADILKGLLGADGFPKANRNKSIPDGGSRPADLRSAAVPVAAELIGADLTPPEDGGVERPGNVLRITPLPS